MKKLLIFTLFSLLSLSAAPWFEVQAIVNRDTIFVGDTLKYTIIISFTEGLRIKKPGISDSIGQFEMKGYNFPPATRDGNVIVEKTEYDLTIYETGEFTIPAQDVYAINKGKTISRKTPAIKIRVRSILENEGAPTDIFDIKENKLPLGYVPKRYIVYVIIPFVLIALVLLIRFLYVRFFRKPPPPVPAYLEAKTAVEELLKKQYYQNKQYKEFYYTLSTIFRRFLERTTEISCTTLTTRQILEVFKIRADANLDFYKSFFTYADRIKFANASPTRPKTEEFLKYINSLIKEEERRFENLSEEFNKEL